MDKYKDKAITIVQTLINATGAEFEDENMAIDIIAGNLKIEEENYVGLHDVTQWVANEVPPDFDGNYLCYIHQPQECDNVWRYYKTIIREGDKWLLDANENVVYWTDKAFPIGISPEPPCG